MTAAAAATLQQHHHHLLELSRDHPCSYVVEPSLLSLRFLLSDLILAALPFFLAPVYDDGLLGFQLFMIQKFGLPFWITAFGKEPRFWECLMFGHGCRVPVTYSFAEFF